MREIYRVGNAQSIGSGQIQSNYFASYAGKDCLLVLADGTIDHINGRRCAVLAVEACMRECLELPPQTQLPAFFDTVAADILYDMHEILYLGKTPYLSFACQLIRDGTLFYYQAGSSRMFLYDGMQYRILAGKSGSETFGKGMTAGIVSNGVWQALHEKDMVSCLAGNGHPYEKAQRMILKVKEKNRKMAGNATIVCAERCL